MATKQQWHAHLQKVSVLVKEQYVKISDKQPPSYSISGSFNVASSVTSAHKAAVSLSCGDMLPPICLEDEFHMLAHSYLHCTFNNPYRETVFDRGHISTSCLR